MDALIAFIKETPIYTWLVLAGIAIVFFTFFDISVGSVKLRTFEGKGYLIPVVIGFALIGSGLLIKSNSPAVLPTPTPTIMADINTPITRPTSVPPTDAPTSIVAEPASPAPVKTLFDGCIASQTWQVKAMNATTNTNNCLNLNSLGFAAENGGNLHVLVAPSKVQSAAGIYTNVSDQSTIGFKVFVNNFYLVYKDKPAYISFAVAPQDNPNTEKGSARFKLQIDDSGNSPLIRFGLADSTQTTGIELDTQHYLYGRTYTIRLVLKGIFMEVYINDSKINQTLNIPSGNKVFYIGYNMPVLASADIDIKDIVIDGVNP